MRANDKFTTEVSSTIMKKAAPVATAGIQSVKNVAEDGLDAGSTALVGAGPSRPGAPSKQADQPAATQLLRIGAGAHRARSRELDIETAIRAA